MLARSRSLGSRAFLLLTAPIVLVAGTCSAYAQSSGLPAPPNLYDAAGVAATLASNIQTAGTGGVTVNTFVGKDTSSPTKMITASSGACGEGVALSTVAAGSTFPLSGVATTVNVLADGPIAAGDVIVGSLTLPGYAHDSGQTSSLLISQQTAVCGIALTTVTASGQLVNINPTARGTRGGLISNLVSPPTPFVSGSYAAGSLVTNSGYVYQALQQVTAGNAPSGANTTTAYWAPIALAATYTPVTVTGDVSINSSGVSVVNSYNGGTTFGSAAGANTTAFDATGAAAAAQAASDPAGSATTAANAAQAAAQTYASSLGLGRQVYSSVALYHPGDTMLDVAGGQAYYALSAVPAGNPPATSPTYFAPISDGQGGKATVFLTIAPSNSPNKKSANYVLTGSADQTMIMAARNTCPLTSSSATIDGCKIHYLPGTIVTTASIVSDNDNIQDECEAVGGYNGYVAAYTSPTAPTMKQPIGGTVFTSTTTTAFPFFLYNHLNPGGNGNDTYRHRGLRLSNCSFSGAGAGTASYYQSAVGTANTGAAGDDYTVFENLFCSNLVKCITGFYDTPTFVNINAQGISSDAFNVSGVLPKIIGGEVFDIGGNCITNSAEGMTVTGLTCGDTKGYGIYQSGNHMTLSSSHFSGNTLGLFYGQGTRGNDLTIEENLFSSAFAYSNPSNGNFPNANPRIFIDAASAGNFVRGTIDSLNPAASGYMTGYAVKSLGVNDVFNINILGGFNCSGTTNIVCGAAIQASPSDIILGYNPVNTTLTSPLLIGQFDAANYSSSTGWANSVSGGTNLTSVGASAPTYTASVAGLNNQPAVLFSGAATNGVWGSNFNVPITDQGRTVIQVIYPTSLAGTLGHNTTLFATTPNPNANSEFISSAANKLSYYANNGVTTSLAALTVNTPYLIVTVIQGGYSRVSVNGSAVSTPFAPGAGLWVGGLSIGADLGAASGNFAGYIATTRVYDGAATSAQINSLVTTANLAATYGLTLGSTY